MNDQATGGGASPPGELPAVELIEELDERAHAAQGRALDVFASVERDTRRADDERADAEERLDRLTGRLEELADESDLPLVWRDLLEYLPVVGNRSLSPRVLEQFLRRRWEKVAGFRRSLGRHSETLLELEDRLSEIAERADEIESTALEVVRARSDWLAQLVEGEQSGATNGGDGELAGPELARRAAALECAASLLFWARQLIRSAEAAAAFVSTVTEIVEEFRGSTEERLEAVAAGFESASNTDTPERALASLSEGADALAALHRSVDSFAREIETLESERATDLYDRIEAETRRTTEWLNRFESSAPDADERAAVASVVSALESASVGNGPAGAEASSGGPAAASTLDEIRRRLERLAGDIDSS
ncbi:MAG: hypothetical protein ABEL76_06815 [Bradymonadaceae bacterium]